MVRKVPAPLRPGFEVDPPMLGRSMRDPDAGGVVSAGGVGFDINCGVRLLVGDVREKCLASARPAEAMRST